jgi:hypothetical protein
MDLWLIIVIVVAAVVILGFLAWLFLRGEPKSMQPLDGAPVDGPVARAIAVGALQLDNDDFPWNDITGSALDQKQQRGLREMWDLTDREAWLENLERLTSGNRFDGPIVAMMAIRDEIAPDHRQPTDRDWLAAIKNHGGTGRGDEKKFVSNVRRWEKNLRKVGTKNFIVYPADYAATSLEGYNIGQAAAMVVWGNAMGFAEPGEAEKLLIEISAIAKRQFGSWEEFGRSYLLGRCVNLYRMTEDNDKVQSSIIGTMWSYRYAFKGEHGGPWATLAW